MKLFRRLLTVGAGTASAQVIAAGSVPILTRVYSPEAHAGWVVFLSIAMVFSGIATLRYELAVVLPRERRTSASVCIAGFFTATGGSALAGIVLHLIGRVVLAPAYHPMLNLWCWLAPLSIISLAAYQLILAWFTRETAFRLYAMAQCSLPVGILIGQLSLAASGWDDAWGLIGGTVAGQAGVAVLFGGIVWLRDGETLWRTISVREVLSAAKEYKNYPLYMAPHTLVGTLRERLAYFLIGRLGTSAAVGYYGLAARLVNLPNSFASSVLRPVFFQHAARRDPGELALPILEIMRLLGCISVLLWAVCATQAAWLAALVFGEEWKPAAPYLIVLSLPVVPLLMGNWADRMFDVLGRQRTALKMEVAFSLLAMLGLLGGYWISRDLLSAVIVQSVLLTAYYCAWLVVLFKVAGYSIKPILRCLLTVAALGVAAWLVCLHVARALPSSLALGLTLTAALIVIWPLGKRGVAGLKAFQAEALAREAATEAV